MSPDPRLSPVDALAQLSFAIHAALERRAAEQGLSLVQTRLLGILRDRRPTINELARLLALEKSSVSGLVDRAQRRGLVARGRSPGDGRAVVVELTAGGRALIDAGAQRFAADVEALLEPLRAAERERLSALVQRMLVADAGHRGVDLFATENQSPPP